MKVKVWEFMDLRQGNMSIAEYTAKFNELARFCPSMVPNDETRKTRYMQGLRVHVAKQIDSGSHGPTSFSDAVQRALRNESWDKAPSGASNSREGGTSNQSGKSASGRFRSGNRSRKKRFEGRSNENRGEIVRTEKKGNVGNSNNSNSNNNNRGCNNNNNREGKRRGGPRTGNSKVQAPSYPLCPKC